MPFSITENMLPSQSARVVVQELVCTLEKLAIDSKDVLQFSKYEYPCEHIHVNIHQCDGLHCGMYALGGDCEHRHIQDPLYVKSDPSDPAEPCGPCTKMLRFGRECRITLDRAHNTLQQLFPTLPGLCEGGHHSENLKAIVIVCKNFEDMPRYWAGYIARCKWQRHAIAIMKEEL